MSSEESTKDPRLHAALKKNQLWLTIDDPTTRNALDDGIVGALAHAIQHVKAEFLVLTGAGHTFSSGGSRTIIQEMVDDVEDNPDAVAQRLRAHSAVIEDLAACPATTIALIDGPCVGAALGIALACDIRIVTAGAQFSTGFANLKLPGDFGTRELLRARLGSKKATQLMKDPSLLSAKEGLSLGLADVKIPQATRKEVKKALKEIDWSSIPRRKHIFSPDFSSILDDEATAFARALGDVSVQVRLEKVFSKRR